MTNDTKSEQYIISNESAGKELCKFTFVVATVDRDKQLQECITSIEKAHRYSPDISVEILIIIQKATKKKDIKLLYPNLTTIHYIDKMGLSVSRNFAIAKSRGDYLIFLDDDAGVSENFIDVLAKKVVEYSDCNAFCGKLMDPVLNSPFSILFYTNEVKKLKRLEYQYFMGSAHVLSRKAIEIVNGYDERFGVGAKHYCGGEETIVFFKLKAASEKVLYLPELVFYHPTIFASPDYVQNYGHAFGALITCSCLHDKAYFFIYIFIILEKVAKSSVRILQKIFLKGVYKEKDERYRFGVYLKGLLQGVKEFIARDILKIL